MWHAMWQTHYGLLPCLHPEEANDGLLVQLILWRLRKDFLIQVYFLPSDDRFVI